MTFDIFYQELSANLFLIYRLFYSLRISSPLNFRLAGALGTKLNGVEFGNIKMFLILKGGESEFWPSGRNEFLTRVCLIHPDEQKIFWLGSAWYIPMIIQMNFLLGSAWYIPMIIQINFLLGSAWYIPMSEAMTSGGCLCSFSSFVLVVTLRAFTTSDGTPCLPLPHAPLTYSDNLDENLDVWVKGLSNST